jgi:Flp pilus assembly pilin Flp
MKRINQKGAALVEYGMLVGLIAVLAITAVITLGGTTKRVFETVSDTVSTNVRPSLSEPSSPATPAAPEVGPPLISFVMPDATLTSTPTVATPGAPDGRLYTQAELDQSFGGFLPPVLYPVDLSDQTFVDAYLVVTNETLANPGSVYNYRGYVQPCFQLSTDNSVRCGSPGADWDHVAFGLTTDVNAIGWRIRPEFDTTVAGSGGTTHGDPAQEWFADLTWEIADQTPSLVSVAKGNFTITRPIQ